MAIPLSNHLVVQRLLVLIPSVLAISILSCSSVVAQSTFTGGLTGVVSDPDGAVVINETNRQDVKLEVGHVSETVKIVAVRSLINPVSPVTGQSIDAALLDRLPLASPNVLFLLLLSSGTSGDLTDVRTNGRGSASITVNGGRTSNNSISLKGINISDFNLAQFYTVPLPNPEANSKGSLVVIRN